jgi:hydrogenase/urease accessory protein HupE
VTARLVALFGALLTLASLLHAGTASAHENTPGVIALRETAQGRFLVRWTPPLPEVASVEVHFPGSCQVNGQGVLELRKAQALPLVLDCGAAGLGGELRFEAANGVLGRIAVNVLWLDQHETFRLSTGSSPTVSFGAAEQPNSGLHVLSQYVWLGVEHIWFGVDHLLFVLGLLVLIKGLRALLTTITAFTLAHSATLAAASLDLVTVPTAPVEICIALSVLLLAVEATREQNTASRRWPWLVAFGFGLLHGLGFAAALSDVGLPKDATLLSLLGFNLGVELGQIAVVAAVAAGYGLMKARPTWQRHSERAAVWVLGVCSVFWLLQRVAGWLEQLGVA